MDTTKINYYKTNVGIFLREQNTSYYNENYFLKDGRSLKDFPLISGWIRLPNDIKELELYTKTPETRKQIGWKLKDESLQSKKIPLNLSMLDLQLVWDDDDDGLVYRGDYKSLGMLYEEVYMPVLAQMFPVPSEQYNCLGELKVDNFENPSNLKVEITNSPRYKQDVNQIVDLISVCTFDEIEAMLVPEFLHSKIHCELSSDQMYKIVRTHIKKHIDLSRAKITSDYDFCFTVKKLIKVKPYTIMTYKHFKAKKPTVAKKVDVKELDFFEMTSASSKYKGYTIINGIKGNNLQDLHDKLNVYLDDLTEAMNAELHECEHCKGYGILVGDKFLTNSIK